MPEYDAFGREIGEDTLAGWRSGAGAGAQPAPVPDPVPAVPGPVPAGADPAPSRAVASADGVTAGDPLGGSSAGGVTAGDPLGAATAERVTTALFGTASAGAPPARRSLSLPRRRRRSGVRWILALVVLFVLVRFVIGVTGTVRDAVRDIEIPSIPTPQAPETAPTGLGAGSLLRPAAFERALADLRERGIGRIQSLRVAPERIDVSLLTRRGTLVTAQIRAGAELRRFGESGAGFGAVGTIPYAKLDAAAPRRLVRAAAGRLGRPVTRIDYLVATYTSGQLTWGAYFKGGAIFLADARGRITRRIS